MFKFVVLVAIVGFVAALDDFAAETKTLENVISPDGGSFHYAYALSNGIEANSDGNEKAFTGGYSYTSPEGVLVKVQYIANENGFLPESPLLPTPPPIPDYVIRAIEWNAAHPQAQEPTLARKV